MIALPMELISAIYLSNFRRLDALAPERSIDVHIRSLRKKHGNRANVNQTVREVGYRSRESFEPELG